MEDLSDYAATAHPWVARMMERLPDVLNGERMMALCSPTALAQREALGISTSPDLPIADLDFFIFAANTSLVLRHNTGCFLLEATTPEVMRDLYERRLLTDPSDSAYTLALMHLGRELLEERLGLRDAMCLSGNTCSLHFGFDDISNPETTE